MTRIATALFTVLILFCVSPVLSQVSNLIVNGSPTNFSMNSGEVISWSFDLPAGATATGELWLDLNVNHVIDPATDRLVLRFTETDGDTVGYDGPPDGDGTVDGSVEFSIAIGFAPQDYIIRFSHNGTGESVWGTVAPLSVVGFTVSGSVTGPPGTDLRYLVIQAESDDESGVIFWQALTDSQGLFTIEMDSDTAGNPWRISFDEPPRPYSVSPRDTNITIDGNITGIVFTLTVAAAQVTGFLVDDAGDSLAYRNLYISRQDGMGSYVYYGGNTDGAGEFWFGVALGDLNGSPWRIAQPYNENQPITTHILGLSPLPVLMDNDSIVRDLKTYLVNSSIDGLVRLNGINPGFPVLMFATNEDTAESFVWSDSATGSFSVPVSDKIADYQLRARDFGGGYDFPVLLTHPGDAGVIYNITTTGVDDGPRGIPSDFALGQNYPNPFNPETTIPYTIASRARVVLSVYDILGRQVAELVNRVEEPGLKTVIFDAASLPSGVYSYRITSGSVSLVRKMLILR